MSYILLLSYHIVRLTFVMRKWMIKYDNELFTVPITTSAFLFVNLNFFFLQKTTAFGNLDRLSRKYKKNQSQEKKKEIAHLN